MSLDYLKFVEAHEDYANFNVFEKVLIATQRAKAIYEEEKVTEDEEEAKRKIKRKTTHKPSYQAILEINEGTVQLSYPEEEMISSSSEAVTPDETLPGDRTILSK